MSKIYNNDFRRIYLKQIICTFSINCDAVLDAVK